MKLARGSQSRAVRHERRLGELKKLWVEKDDRGRVELEARAKKAEESLVEFIRANEVKEQSLQAEINTLKGALSKKESDLANQRMQAEMYKKHMESFSDARQQLRESMLRALKSSRLTIVVDFLQSPAFGFSQMDVTSKARVQAFSDCIDQLKRAGFLSVNFGANPKQVNAKYGPTVESLPTNVDKAALFAHELWPLISPAQLNAPTVEFYPS